LNKPRASFLGFPILLALLAFAFQGGRGIYWPDEGYYVSIAQSMLDRKDWLVPILNDGVWLDKPPLSMWGIASGLSTFGRNEFGARAFVGLCYFLTALLVYLLGTSLKNRSFGLLAGVIYATMLLPFVAGNVCTPDGPLTLFTTFTFLFFWFINNPRHSHVTACKVLLTISLGLGFLTKGPAVFVPTCSIVLFMLVRKRTLRIISWQCLLLGIVLFSAFGVLWYAVISIRIPGSLSYFFDNQVWGRTVSSKYSRNAGLFGSLIYIPTIIIGASPWTVIWFMKLKRIAHRQRLSSILNTILNDPADLLIGLWILIPLAILLMANSRLPLYALPLFPAIALATSRIMYPLFSQNTAVEGGVSFSRRQIACLMSWALVLITAKYASTRLPHVQDTRAVFRAMECYLPAGEYEVVSVDMHLEGLSLYLSAPEERVTTSTRPYPLFTLPEHIDEELAEVRSSSHAKVFLTKGESTESLRSFLCESQITFREHMLPYRRSMFVVE